jgi:5-methylcytosine-specific restriction enzyme subunit McrC
MKAKDYFQNSIKDNCYYGTSVNTIVDFSTDFNCDTYYKQYKTPIRKEGIRNFILELHRILATRKLSELNISQITFDDEFEANKDQKIFEIQGNDFENLKIYTGNIVGSIIYKSCHFNINCRFGNEFLQYMIANTSGFLELENFGAIDSNIGLGEWILTYYWKLQLRKAFSLGLYKSYKTKHSNLPTVRGKIDINSIIKKPYFDGKTLCEFKEHCYSNELNSIIAMALRKVFRSKFQHLVNDIYNIKNAFDSIIISKVDIKSIRSQKVINPYFRKYNQVFELSLKILKDEFANVGDKNSEFSAFLFDISLLFEHHIRKILKQKYLLFPKNKSEFVVPNGFFESNIYPDIIIDYGNNEIGIYDVKYKHFTFDGNEKGVERNDRFQLITYVATHLAKYKVVECGFIYPLRETDLVKVKNIRMSFLKIGTDEIPFNVKFYIICNQLENQIDFDKKFIEDLHNSNADRLHSHKQIVFN